MELGMVGLGRMGANMVRRLLRGGHRCVGFDLKPEAREALAREGAPVAQTLDDLIQALAQPRAVWIMVPAGPPTEATVMALAQRLSPGDMIVDGGNTHYRDDVRRARLVGLRGIRYVDAGTSGGIRGLERGYCLMLGGDPGAVARLDPLFRTLAPLSEDPARRGYVYCGPSGAGHFVKMVHNGIEYGLMQAYAEGFEILRGAGSIDLTEGLRYEFSLGEIAEAWRHGSVVASWLLDLAAEALAEDPSLSAFTGFVEDSGEGRWTVMTAVEETVSAEVISAALFARFRSRKTGTFAEKVLSALRHKFGGHAERPSGG